MTGSSIWAPEVATVDSELRDQLAAALAFKVEEAVEAGGLYLGEYEAGLVIDVPNKFFSYNYLLVTVETTVTLPYITTGVFETEWVNFQEFGGAVGSLEAQLANASDSGEGDAMLAVKKLAAGVNAVARTQHQVNEEEVTLNDFADIPDAIAWAMSTTGRRAIILPGGDLDMTGSQFLLPPNLTDPSKYGLVRPLYFMSKGGTRIFKNDAGTLFDVAGSVTDPNARFLDLFVSGIEFESDLNLGTVTFNTDQIYRLYVDSCAFRAVDYPFAGTVGNYAQTVHATNNSCHGAKAFWRSDYAFDIKATDNVIEHSENGFLFNGTTSAYVLYSGEISDNVIEGLSGAAIISGAMQGVSIRGNYVEENLTADFELALSGNSHKGLVIQGNMFQHPTARVTSGSPAISWGLVGPAGAVSGGNTCLNGNMHNFGPGSGFVDMQGDAVTAGKALYNGHISLLSPTRAAVGKAEFTEGARKVIGAGNTYVALDANTCAVDFGIGAYSATIAGELIPACIAIGSTNPQTSPGNYGTRKWAIGSEILNVAINVLGAPGSQYTVTGWKCTVSGQGGGAGSDRWVEMRALTGT